MQYAEFPILSLIIFSPVLGIALAGVFRDATDGIPAKVAALSSSLLTFLLSLYLWFHFDASEEGLQLVEHRQKDISPTTKRKHEAESA